ncbi:MAG: hypothetical protein ACOC2U_01180 [bacterium]
MEDNKLILVYYISVIDLDPEDIPNYMERVRDKISIPDFNGHSIFIPVFTNETRIECINPKYITEKDLIKEHVSLMKKLNVDIQYSIDELNKY